MNEQSLERTIRNMARTLEKLARLAVQVLLIALLGFLIAVFFLLPWLIRAGGLLLWLYGAYQMVLAIDAVYAEFTAPLPLYSLYVFVITLQIAFLALAIYTDRRLVWGALYIFGTIPLWVALYGIPALLDGWQHATLFFQMLPTALWVVMLLYITMRGKAKRQLGYKPSRWSLLVPALAKRLLDKIDNQEVNEKTTAPLKH